MKKVLLSAITVYQKGVSPLFHQLLGINTACRNAPSCTIYAKEAITQYGLGKGLLLSLRRIYNCQPYFTL